MQHMSYLELKEYYTKVVGEKTKFSKLDTIVKDSITYPVLLMGACFVMKASLTVLHHLIFVTAGDS